jgi:hypothetical protein
MSSSPVCSSASLRSRSCCSSLTCQRACVFLSCTTCPGCQSMSSSSPTTCTCGQSKSMTLLGATQWYTSWRSSPLMTSSSSGPSLCVFLRLLINNSDLCFGKALLLLMCNDLIPTMLRTMFCVVLALSGACTGLAPGHSLGCADGEGLIEKYGRAA